MKVYELVETCQNQWVSGFKYNSLFTITFSFRNSDVIEVIHNKIFYKCDEFEKTKIDFKYFEKRRFQDVLAWQMKDINNLEILLRDF